MRLIDADALKEELCKEYRHFSQRIAIFQVFEAIKKAPTLDAVPVVRCRNCEHAEVYNYLDMWCNKFDRAMGYKWFCSFGDRRTDG